MMELPPGPHQLTVTATHPSGLFTTNASVTFTNNAANEVVMETYDGRGKVTQRIWKSAAGTTNRIQTLQWNLRGRLDVVTDFDTNQYGYYLSLAYDPFDRRVAWYFVPMGPGSLGSRKRVHYFDPLVEFLELGQQQGVEPSVWKVYGPDLNGRYGGMNGTGGFDAMASEATFQPVIADARGNVLGGVTNGAVSWNAARPTGYGAVPGYRPVPLWHGADVVQASAWRGRWADISGYVWLGARYYDPESGRFLDSDPVWNERDPNYYTFAGGDPVNYFDSDGRLGKQAGNLSQSFMNPGHQAIQMLETAWSDFWGNGGGIEGLNVAYNHNNPFTPAANLIYQENILTGQEFTWWGDYSENVGHLGLNLLAMTALGGVAREADLLLAQTRAISMETTALTRSGGSFANWGGEFSFADEAGFGAVPPAGGGTMALSPYRVTGANETFQHYSYMQHAQSLLGGLWPNSYATSVQGLSGAEAQSGLALPHLTPPNAVYTVTPNQGTFIQVNPLAQPLYGQPGGLPEVRFIFGTEPGTVSGPTLIR